MAALGRFLVVLGSLLGARRGSTGSNTKPKRPPTDAPSELLRAHPWVAALGRSWAVLGGSWVALGPLLVAQAGSRTKPKGPLTDALKPAFVGVSVAGRSRLLLGGSWSLLGRSWALEGALQAPAPSRKGR
jgi:hypothetical protein